MPTLDNRGATQYRLTKNAYQRKDYDQRRVLGLCVRCGQPAMHRRVYCASHLQALREYAAARRVVIPGVELAHCGCWHPVTTLPLHCPSCGRTWVER
jgi:hypothetical protein